LKRYAETLEAQANKSFYDKHIESLSVLYVILGGQATDDTKYAYLSDSDTLSDDTKPFTLQTLPAPITERVAS
jgi:hypothetical protein